MGLVMLTLEDRVLRVVTRGTGETFVRADRGPATAGAVLERVDLAHGRVALRLPDGRYLARHLSHDSSDDHGAALHLVGEVTQCAAFEELPSPDGSVALRGCDLLFLGVHPSGAVVADRVADGSYERFSYLDAPVTLFSVPTQPSPVLEPVGHAAAAGYVAV